MYVCVCVLASFGVQSKHKIKVSFKFHISKYKISYLIFANIEYQTNFWRVQ